MEQWGYAFPAEWGKVKTPTWSKALQRVARGARGIYWNHLRFRNPRRPGQQSKSPFPEEEARPS
jgi:hypothetical protein